MEGITIWHRRRFPANAWLDADPRLRGAGNLAELLEEVYCISYDDTRCAADANGELLPAPMELVKMLRHAADRIEEWTDLDHTL